MIAPWVFWLSSPIRFAVWGLNRLVANVGLLVAWRRLKHAPNRVRRFMPWLVLVNVLSILALVGMWRLLTRRG